MLINDLPFNFSVSPFLWWIFSSFSTLYRENRKTPTATDKKIYI